jgi:hypothetical protein
LGGILFSYCIYLCADICIRLLKTHALISSPMFCVNTYTTCLKCSQGSTPIVRYTSLCFYRSTFHLPGSKPVSSLACDLTTVFVNSAGGRITGGAKPSAALRSDCGCHASVLPSARDHTSLQAVMDQRTDPYIIHQFSSL